MIEKSVQIGKRTISFETGVVARQASGSVIVRDGDSVVLVALVAERKPASVDFFPLTVEYRENMAAAGRVPGNYFRREARASEGEVLSSRLIDRSIRPLFPDAFRCETQITAQVLSYDPETDPAILGILGASAALMISEVPWEGPVAGARIARANGRWVAFPSPAELETSDVDLVVTASGNGGLVMVEGEAKEVPEEEILAALAFAEEALRPANDLLRELAKVAGRPKRAALAPAVDPALEAAVAVWQPRIEESLSRTGKTDRGDAKRALVEEIAAAPRDPALDPEELLPLVHERFDRTSRNWILESGRRLDGRGLSDVRPIEARVGWLPRVHGSCLFTRGETQAIVSVTLGSNRDEQEIESLDGVRRESFLLHYNFPHFSVGETGPMKGPGRREIGHGNLARRAVAAVLPGADEFPYTIRVDSRITESNGSSSMATVCGSSLALMDAGVPIRRPVAGVAMGLISDEGRRVFRVLTDILGDEDHLGDMDFKVAGTERGVTAIQLDNKLGTLPVEVLREGVANARAGRMIVLARMAEVLREPRSKTSPHAPQVGSAWINPKQIPALIGSGGSTIQGLQNETQTKIEVEQTGRVRVFATSASGLDRALVRIEEITGDPTLDAVYEGTVTGVKDFGCFVKIVGGNEGLVLAEDLAGRTVQMGAKMKVKVVGVTEKGKIRLSVQTA